MESVKATPALREHRLYQVDYLVRQYGYEPGEVVFGADGNLPLAHDPKVAWALAHPERFPVDVRTASVEELVRVPGIGPESARRLVGQRGVRGIADLRRLGVVTTRAVGFITLGGRRLLRERYHEQLALWRPEDDVGVRQRAYEVSPGTFR